MQTSVFKTLLHVSGDIVSGGDIDSVDSIIAGLLVGDALKIPITGSAGTGSIDGENFKIGQNQPIQRVHSRLFSSWHPSLGGQGFQLWSPTTQLAKLTQVSGVPEFTIDTSTGSDFLRFGPGYSNFIDGTFIVNSTATVDGGLGYNFQVAGFARLTQGISIGTDTSINGTQVESGNARFSDVGSNIWLSDWYDDWTSVDSFVQGLPSNLGDLTTSEVTQLSNIGTRTISSTQWGRVEAMQDVSTIALPTFSGGLLGQFKVFLNNTLSYTPAIGMKFNTDTSGNFYFKTVGNLSTLWMKPDGQTVIYDARTIQSRGFMEIDSTTGMNLTALSTLALQGATITLDSIASGYVGANYTNDKGLAVFTNGETIINTPGTPGLQFRSSASTGIAYYRQKTNLKGWSLSPLGVMTIDDLVATNLSTPAVSTASLTVYSGGTQPGNAIAKVFKVAQTKFYITMGGTTQHAEVIAIDGVRPGDAVIPDVRRSSLSYSPLITLNFHGVVESNDEVSIYIVNSVAANITAAEIWIGFTVIQYV